MNGDPRDTVYVSPRFRALFGGDEEDPTAFEATAAAAGATAALAMLSDAGTQTPVGGNLLQIFPALGAVTQCTSFGVVASVAGLAHGGSGKGWAYAGHTMALVAAPLWTHLMPRSLEARDLPRDEKRHVSHLKQELLQWYIEFAYLTAKDLYDQDLPLVDNTAAACWLGASMVLETVREREGMGTGAGADVMDVPQSLVALVKGALQSPASARGDTPWRRATRGAHDTFGRLWEAHGWASNTSGPEPAARTLVQARQRFTIALNGALVATQWEEMERAAVAIAAETVENHAPYPSDVQHFVEFVWNRLPEESRDRDELLRTLRSYRAPSQKQLRKPALEALQFIRAVLVAATSEAIANLPFVRTGAEGDHVYAVPPISDTGKSLPETPVYWPEQYVGIARNKHGGADPSRLATWWVHAQKEQRPGVPPYIRNDNSNTPTLSRFVKEHTGYRTGPVYEAALARQQRQTAALLAGAAAAAPLLVETLGAALSESHPTDYVMTGVAALAGIGAARLE